MFSRYLLLKSQDKILTPFFMDFLKGYLGANIKTLELSEGIVVYFSLDTDIDGGIDGLIVESNYTIKAFISDVFKDEKLLEENYNILSNYFFKVNLDKNLYNERDFLLELVLKGHKDSLSKVVFKTLSHDNEMLNTIKVYLENDMNVIKASAKLYMHRNTLNNKIEKFNKVTGYDIKSFKDSFIIYHLL